MAHPQEISWATNPVRARPAPKAGALVAFHQALGADEFETINCQPSAFHSPHFGAGADLPREPEV